MDGELVFNRKSVITKRLTTFLGFAGISGLGWLLDVTILLVLTNRLHLQVFYANFISSSVAALCVFLSSRLIVFEKQESFLGVRLLLYWMYILCVIFIAASMIQLVMAFLSHTDAVAGLSETLRVACAKVIITPPQLLLNFCVARFVIEKRISAS